LAYSDAEQWSRTAMVVLLLAILVAGLGLAWSWRRWLVVAGIFAGIYVPLFTSLFSNPFGFFTGMVGSLGYWLVQQGVERGSQPLYYYLVVQIPVYEYLPAIGAILAGVYAVVRAAIRTKHRMRRLSRWAFHPPSIRSFSATGPQPGLYSIAAPCPLTVHITSP
jgi:hypothetical protein